MKECNPVKNSALIAVALCAVMFWIGTAYAQRLIDNGDGTITDTVQGLMWEKKTGEVGGKETTKDPNDVNTHYPWSNSDTFPESTYPNGGTFTKFLGRLNSETSTDGEEIGGCFANHCDWRIPSIDELRGIVDKSVAGCGQTAACIDPIFGPTVPAAYWSYSTARVLTSAYRVDFKDGSFDVVEKNAEKSYVRAVRSDPCAIPGFCTSPSP